MAFIFQLFFRQIRVITGVLEFLHHIWKYSSMNHGLRNPLRTKMKIVKSYLKNSWNGSSLKT